VKFLRPQLELAPICINIYRDHLKTRQEYAVLGCGRDVDATNAAKHFEYSRFSTSIHFISAYDAIKTLLISFAISLPMLQPER